MAHAIKWIFLNVYINFDTKMVLVSETKHIRKIKKIWAGQQKAVFSTRCYGQTQIKNLEHCSLLAIEGNGVTISISSTWLWLHNSYTITGNNSHPESMMKRVWRNHHCQFFKRSWPTYCVHECSGGTGDRALERKNFYTQFHKLLKMLISMFFLRCDPFSLTVSSQI